MGALTTMVLLIGCLAGTTYAVVRLAADTKIVVRRQPAALQGQVPRPRPASAQFLMSMHACAAVLSVHSTRRLFLQLLMNHFEYDKKLS